MAQPTVRTRLSRLIHRSLSNGIFRAIQADSLATAVADRRSWINNSGYGSLFRTLQVVLADELVLSVTRMFDPVDPKYPTQSIPAVLRFLRLKAPWLPVQDRARLEKLLVSAGASPSEVQALDKASLTRRVAAHFQSRFPNPDKWRVNRLGSALRALRFRRNKQVAHTEHVSHRKRVKADWDDARVLLQWALEFADAIGVAYLQYYFLASDGRTFLSNTNARQASRDLERLLDKAGLPKGRFRRRRAA